MWAGEDEVGFLRDDEGKGTHLPLVHSLLLENANYRKAGLGLRVS